MPDTSADDEVLGPDFTRLWTAYTASEVGTAVGSGALPLVAVLALDSSSWQVSLLAALSGIVSAVLALPAGPTIEHRRKRPVMMAADLARAVALASVPVAAALHVLSFIQLCVVTMVSTTGAICFSAASGAHLKALVPAGLRPRANARFEGTFWTVHTLGAPLGGVLISWLGTTSTMAIDAVSYVLSAAGVRSIRRPEPAPPVRAHGRRLADLGTGWRYIADHRMLRRLLVASVLFSGSIFMCSPIMSVFLLRELDFKPWQYGLAMGLPALGGLVGARLMPSLLARFGERRVLLFSGIGRTLPVAIPALAPHGYPGLVLIIAADFVVLLFAGVFNPTQIGLRQREVADEFMSRVGASWTISSRVAQPLFMLVGGAMATFVGLRGTIVVSGVIALASAVVLMGAPTRPLEEAT